MDPFEELYRQNKPKVVVGRKTAQEFIDSITNKVDIELASLSILPKSLLDKLQFNIRHHYLEVESTERDLREYKLYTVIRNEKSNEYYTDYEYRLFYTKIYILFEMKTGLFQTNCSRLRAELGILRGLSPNDLDERTVAFKEYMAFFM